MFPEKSIRNMLHALGISHSVRSNEYIQPNKRYRPYPTSHRNYYQVDDCVHWNELIKQGYATQYTAIGMNIYSVSKAGKEYLRSLGYKWHEGK